MSWSKNPQSPIQNQHRALYVTKSNKKNISTYTNTNIDPDTDTDKCINKCNKVSLYSSHILKSDIAKTNPILLSDIDLLLKNKCIYLPNFMCELSDNSLFDNLKTELTNNPLVKWSSHFKFENPDFSETFNKIIAQMAKNLDVKVLQSRLNYYPDGSSFKPMHKDRHAYINDENKKIKENFTMGASFGASRCLDFIHEESGEKFTFPQNNGDIFAFDSDVNKKFLHGVPKTNKKIGPRFSVIAWGIKKFI